MLLDGALAIVAKGARASLDAGQIAELHRCTHCVAGGAATLGFEQAAALARALEERLDRYRTGGEKLDSATIAHCAEALSMLLEMLAGLQAGELRASGPIEQMIASLGLPLGNPAGYEAAGLVRNLRSIRFVLSRSLAGADILIEHVLEDLGRLGRIARVQAPPEGATGVWCIELESRAEDAGLIDVLDQIAEPGSLRIDRDSDRGGGRAYRDGPPIGLDASEAGAGASRSPDRTSLPNQALYAQPGPTAIEHVSFRVGGQWFAVSASRILGVAPYRGEIRMPGVSPVLLGMLAIAGEPIPLVHAHLALGVDPSDAAVDDAARVVLMDTLEGPIGLLADDIGDRLQLRPDELKRPRALPGLVAGSPVTGFVFVQDEACSLLDPDRFCAFLAGFDGGPAIGGDASNATTGPRPHRAMMQDGASSAIMATSRNSRMPVRRATTRPVVRGSLEEEWKQRDP